GTGTDDPPDAARPARRPAHRLRRTGGAAGAVPARRSGRHGAGGMRMTTRLPTVYEDDKDVYRTLLESTKAIPWKIDWGTMRFAYVGPQIEAVLGWSHGSWLTVNDWAERIHPEDRQKTLDFCVAQ